MHATLAITVLAAVLSCALAACNPRGEGELYCFGPDASDSVLNGGFDPRQKMQLRGSYVFYGKAENVVYVGDNGFVTFELPAQASNPQSFPVRTIESLVFSKIVAPYWSDVDTRCGGYVWYRETVGSSPTLSAVANDIALSNKARNFIPTSAIIVTWEGVSFTGGTTSCTGLRNTYQLAIATDGSETYSVFIYNTLTWTTSKPGRINIATAGFNRGDVITGFNVPSSGTRAILDLVNQSNMEGSSGGSLGALRGVFVYAIHMAPSVQIVSMQIAHMMENAEAFAALAQEEAMPLTDPNIPESQFNKPEHVHHPSYYAAAMQDTPSLFGFRDNSDGVLAGSDGAISGRIPVQPSIPFFGVNHNFLFAYTDGYVTLGDIYMQFRPTPLKDVTTPIVASFFTDIDTRGRGLERSAVYYNLERGAPFLEKAARHILDSTGVNFAPTILFITTWDSVGYYQRNTDKLNTFQSVIASDGTETYVLFLYEKIEWVSPDSVVPPGTGGLGGALPSMGIGDGKGFQKTIRGVNTESDVLSLPEDNKLVVFSASKSRATSQDAKAAYEDIKVKLFSEYGAGMQAQSNSINVDRIARELENIENKQ